ncbi:hypothetical protein ACWD0G_22540, partial [Streptomyces goshikiensis]
GVRRPAPGPGPAGCPALRPGPRTPLGVRRSAPDSGRGGGCLTPPCAVVEEFAPAVARTTWAALR